MRPIVNVPEKDPATDVGDVHKKLVKSREWFRRYPVEQTDRQTHSSQYSATALAGEITKWTIELQDLVQFCAFAVVHGEGKKLATVCIGLHYP